jgi:hypothetical protein
MDPWVQLIGGAILLAVGVWTVTHPDGGYRATGGLGSSFSPATRRVLGILLIGAALALIADAGLGSGEEVR